MDYTNIDELINDFQLMIDDTSYDKDAQIYQLRLLALQGLRELTFDVEQVVRTAQEVVTSNLAISLPGGFVKMLRIGFKNSNNEFVPLGYKSNLSLDSTVASQVNDDLYDENNPYYHVDLGKKFGIGGGQNTLGYYRINRSDNVINVSSELAGKTLFIEYISDGISVSSPQNHIISLAFNAVTDTQIINGATFRIPSPTNSSTYNTFTVKVSTEAPTLTNKTLWLSPGNGATTVASKFKELINNGHPDYGISTLNTSLTASNVSGSAVVTLTYNDRPAESSYGVGTNYELDVHQNKVISREIDLIQQGSGARQPRVHKFCEEALRSYIYYKYIQRKRGIPANEKQAAKRAYFNEKRLARARMMNFNKETAMQVSRKAFKQSPKL
jgi:hypothetical protein